jgi:hypothetical protein
MDTTLTSNFMTSFTTPVKKDKQKDLFITKAKHLNTCELKT